MKRTTERGAGILIVSDDVSSLVYAITRRR